MIQLVLDALTWVFVITGALFCMISAYGLIKMPDFYTRTHAASLGDTMGAGLILVGLMFAAPSMLVVVKLAFTLAFLWFTGPIATHALVKAGYARGLAVEDPGAAHAD